MKIVLKQTIVLTNQRKGNKLMLIGRKYYTLLYKEYILQRYSDRNNVKENP